jgi:hypothetical protein
MEDSPMSELDDLVLAHRRTADEVLGRTKERGQVAEWLTIRDHKRQAEDAKTARLRELRLAKEAAERAERTEPAHAELGMKPIKGVRRKKSSG